MQFRNTKLAAVGVAIATLTGAGHVVAQPKPGTKPTTILDHSELAERLVGKTANVREGEIVEILGSPTDMPLMEALAVAVRKRGAHPLLVVDSDSLARKMAASVPATWDAQAPALHLGLAKLIDVIFIIPPVRDPSIRASIPPARRAVMENAMARVTDIECKRGVRLVELDNGFFPTAHDAKQLGLTEAELSKIYWSGISADYTEIEAQAQAIKARLAAGGVLRVTHPNGTDITMKVKGRNVGTSDGVISDADIKAGCPQVGTWLPAGEVFVTPIPGSANGTLVDDRLVFDGNEVTGVTLHVEKGKITSISATSGWESVKPRYDAAGPGKNEIGLFDMGINPAITTRGQLESWVGAGMVTIGIGENHWAGGAIKDPFSIAFHLPGTTVTLDGEALVTDGVLARADMTGNEAAPTFPARLGQPPTFPARLGQLPSILCVGGDGAFTSARTWRRVVCLDDGWMP